MLIECHIMIGHQIDNACWQLYKTFLEDKFVDCWIARLFPPIVIFTIVQKQSGKVLFLVFFGVNIYPWEIVGMDLVTGLYDPEFHFATIIDSCLPSEMAHFFSCHKKLPLTKQ